MSSQNLDAKYESFTFIFYQLVATLGRYSSTKINTCNSGSISMNFWRCCFCRLPEIYRYRSRAAIIKYEVIFGFHVPWIIHFLMRLSTNGVPWLGFYQDRLFWHCQSFLWSRGLDHFCFLPNRRTCVTPNTPSLVQHHHHASKQSSRPWWRRRTWSRTITSRFWRCPALLWRRKPDKIIRLSSL